MPTIKTRTRQVGDKYGNLELISFYMVKIEGGTRKFWKCKCICGNPVERRDDYLSAFPNNNFSCGCKHSMKILGSSNVNWDGHGDISGMYFAGFRCKARKHNIEFNITIEQIWNLYLEQDRKCALTGLPIDFIQSQRLKIKNGTATTASLDRIDSTKGYTIDNVQWIHKDVNKMKNAFTQDRYIEICKLVAEQFK